MKGSRHNVIEIKDTQNSNIEKILIFLTPGQNKIDIDTTKKEAEDILRKVKVRKKLPPISAKAKMIIIGTLSLLLSLFIIYLLI